MKFLQLKGYITESHFKMAILFPTFVVVPSGYVCIEDFTNSFIFGKLQAGEEHKKQPTILFSKATPTRL